MRARIKSFVAEVILFSDIEVRNGDVVTIRCGTAEKKCKVQSFLERIDLINLTNRRQIPKGPKWRGRWENCLLTS